MNTSNTISNTISSIELGSFLCELREKANMKQSELAKNIGWSPATLLRVESGERLLSDDELQKLVKSIGTKEALKLLDIRKYIWQVLPRPPLNHPDQSTFLEAEQILQQLEGLCEQPDIKPAFQRRLSDYSTKIKISVEKLLKRDHQIAFIGSIGIGKSTAICKLTDLIIQNNGKIEPVLETGGGGTTICEVYISTGTNYEIRIEPCTDEEIHAYIRDFAEQSRAKKDDIDGESQGISKEINRALRNMSGLLSIKKEDEQSKGKKVRIDYAKNLAQKFDSQQELVVEIITRMALHKRNTRNTTYHNMTGKSPLQWLKDTFVEINNGRHPDFTLPKRIEIIVPSLPLNHEECSSISIIDTKGTDKNAARADLEKYLTDLHTLNVLCSSFNQAPDQGIQFALERAKNIGIQTLELNSTLLVLPRPREALAMKDDSGHSSESFQEGYELKEEQVKAALGFLKLVDLPIYFFNAEQDDNVADLQEFLKNRISEVRNSFRTELSELIRDAGILITNRKKEQIQAVICNAGNIIKSAIKNYDKLPGISAYVWDDLLKQIDGSHASTVRATINRQGLWANLNYYYHLGYGARWIAVNLLEKRVADFKAVLQMLYNNEDYNEAHAFIRQVENAFDYEYSALLSKIQTTGLSHFSQELASNAGNLWSNCESEWGGGPGYRDRVIKHNRAWFGDSLRTGIDKKIKSELLVEWRKLLETIGKLIEVD
ncbi:MAG: hypothetical protein RIT27_490 [Pseudomonadota bacterium]|jgi:transcriptional regulator with XRE-family HTH domain